MCKRCNIGAAGEKEPKEVKEGSQYVGETSRTIYERSKEHWGAMRSRSEKSHMFKHQQLEHGGAEPEFVMRSKGYFRSALSRQIAEAVQIRHTA